MSVGDGAGSSVAEGVRAGPAARACSHSISQRLSRSLALLTMVILATLFTFSWFGVKAMIIEKSRADLEYRSMVIADIIELEARSGGEAAVRKRVQADAAMRANSKLELWYDDGTTCWADTSDGKRAMSPYVHSLDFDISVAGVPGDRLHARYTADYAREHAMGQRWALIFVLTTLASGALVALGTRWRTRVLLKPLKDLAAQTRAISPERLHQRLQLDDPAEELRPWIDQFNALMQRTDRAYAQLEAFNADVAHELRTPLATLMMQTELALARDRPADELRETMACSLEELQRMSALVNDMLFLSQADRGAAARRGDPVSLASLAREVVDFHEASFDEAGSSVVIEGDVEMAVDAALVRRALSNLIGNACRFANRGSVVRVQISTDAGSPPGRSQGGPAPSGGSERSERGGTGSPPGRSQGGPAPSGGSERSERGGTDSMAWITVHNEGAAVAQEDLPRLFTRFFKADASRCCDENDDQHFGLGLAIVAAIARMHGGEPFAQSGAAGTSIGFVLGRQA
jgi:two-component system heavy metal sensor histidine kinase CusS